MESNSVCNYTSSNWQNRTAAKRESDLSELWQKLRKELDIGYTFSLKTKTKTVNSAKWGATTRAHDAFCPLTQAWRINCPLIDAYTVLLVLKSGWWWPITFEDFVVVWLKEWKEKKNELRISLWQADGLEEKGLLSLNSQINCWSMSRKSQSPFKKTWPRGARIWTNQSKKV